MRLLQEVRTRLGNYQIKSGLYHYYRGEYSQALEYFDKALTAENVDEADESLARYYMAQSFISAAERFEEEGELDKAIESYERAVASHSDYADLHFRLGRLQRMTGELEEAAASLQTAVQWNAEYREAHLALGFVLLDRADLAGAETVFCRVQELAMAAVADPCSRARESLASGDAEGAREWYKEAFVRQPHRFDYHYKCGLTLLRKNKLEAAIEHLEKAIDFNPKFADVYNYLGVALVENDQIEAGTQAFLKSVELNPDYMVAQLNLGFALAGLGRKADAVGQLRFVLEKEPKNEAARSMLDELTAPVDARKQSGESTL